MLACDAHKLAGVGVAARTIAAICTAYKSAGLAVPAGALLARFPAVSTARTSPGNEPSLETKEEKMCTASAKPKASVAEAEAETSMYSR